MYTYLCTQAHVRVHCSQTAAAVNSSSVNLFFLKHYGNSRKEMTGTCWESVIPSDRGWVLAESLEL